MTFSLVVVHRRGAKGTKKQVLEAGTKRFCIEASLENTTPESFSAHTVPLW